MASSPELFVVCKNCRSQVSPYITECPYCGTRLRKRAPKIEREGDRAAPKARRRARRPSLPPLRRGEMPGVRSEMFGKPRATILLVAIGCLWWLALVPLREESIAVVVSPLGDWWQVLTAPFVHASGWYQFAGLGALGLYGWLLERKHGPVVVLAVWLLAASGGMAVVKAVDPEPFAMGATGGAIGMLCAWAVPILLAKRRAEDVDDADLLGTAVIFALLALLPAAREEVSAIATVSGAALGSLAGLALSRR